MGFNSGFKGLKRYKQGIKGSNKRKQTHEYWLQILKFILEQAMKTQRGSRGKLYSFFNLGAIWRWRSAPLPGRFTPGQETGYTQSDIYWNVPTWTCATAHFSEHVSMQAARNVLTAIRVIN
jgi:hypothetical protein